MRSFHLLLRAYRLYDESHPQVLDGLDSAYDTLREVASEMDGMEARAERGGIVVSKLGESHLPDPRGEFHALATDLTRADIQVIYFSKKFHVGELDTLARLIKATLLKSEESAKRLGRGWWPNQLRELIQDGLWNFLVPHLNLPSQCPAGNRQRNVGAVGIDVMKCRAGIELRGERETLPTDYKRRTIRCGEGEIAVPRVDL